MGDIGHNFLGNLVGVSDVIQQFWVEGLELGHKFRAEQQFLKRWFVLNKSIELLGRLIEVTVPAHPLFQTNLLLKSGFFRVL